MSLSIGKTFLVPFLGNEMNKSPQLLYRGSTKRLIPKDHRLQDACKYQYYIMSDRHIISHARPLCHQQVVQG